MRIATCILTDYPALAINITYICTQKSLPEYIQDSGYTYPSYVNIDMRRRLPSLWSVFQVSNSQIYEALCYLCTLSTVGQTLTFLSTQKRKFNTGFGNQASCSQTHYIIPLSSVCDKISQAFSKGGPEDMTSCHSNNWCTPMTF